MKRIYLGLGMILMTGVACAQSDSISLPALSRARSAVYTAQQAKVKSYAASRKVPLFFSNEGGNTVKLVGISPSGLPIYFTTLNAGAAITTGAAQLENGGASGLVLKGDGMLVGVWDGGLVKTHIELGQRVIAKEGSIFDSHATHVTGTLIASGIDPAAKGMAPLAQASTHDFDNDEAEMAGLATPTQTSLLFSSHSYGTATGWYKTGGVWHWAGDPTVNPIEDYRFGFYDSRAQTIDQIAYLAPYYTIVWAAGNDRADVGDGSKPVDCNGGSGFDCIIPESVSKNIIAVGAVNKVLTYSNPFDVSMSFFSSWGPTDDGRIKPDLVAAGVNLYSLSAAGTNTYTTMSGTSMATPNVTGSLVLLQELYSKLHGGSFMKAATLKALAIHTTKEAGNFPGPDYSFGWGLLDVAAAAKLLVNQDGENILVQELSLQNGNSFSLNLTPKVNQKITATIVWTDPPAQPLTPSLDPTALNLVNDLDLRIIDDQGREQLPWALDPTDPSHKAVLADNFRDNVEKLEFTNPEGKNYTLVVRHKANLATPHQAFSLILSYQSMNSPTTFYWVGDAGNWADGSHWSTSSGGAASFLIPGPGDNTVVDENSFDGVGNDLITLTQDASCSSLVWINSKPSGISFNNNTINLTSQCTIASPTFFIQTNGNFRFLLGPSPGNFFVKDANLKRATLIFDAGNWNMKGHLKADELRFNLGTLNISESQLSVDRLNSTTLESRNLNLDHTDIRILQSSSWEGGTSITANNTSFTIDSAVVSLLWAGLVFPGEIKVGPGAMAILGGKNHIGKMSVEGQIKLNDINEIDTLFLAPGSQMDLAPGIAQILTGQTQLSGTAADPVTISSISNSALWFADHVKLCFDYLIINNVEITGSAQVNAGTHSILTNAINWYQKICTDVVFADFDYRYNCAGGLTEFTNRSTGHIVLFGWNFGGDAGIPISDINPVIKFKTVGIYPVSLLATDSTSDNSDYVVKNIEIIENTLEPNRIILNGSTVMSLDVGVRYQWYRDGVALVGETGRSYSLSESEGSYFVLAYDAKCNISSDTLTISGLSNENEDIQTFPNPASESINIKIPAKDFGQLVLTDLLGKNYLVESLIQPETRISVESVPNGIYILQVNLAGKKVRRKIAVVHGDP